MVSTHSTPAAIYRRLSLCLIAAALFAPPSAAAPPDRDPAFGGRGAASWSLALRARDRARRREAVRRLIHGGEKALPVLAELLRGDNVEVQKQAEAILARIGRPAVPVLIRLATDTNARTRYHAVSALRDLGSDAVQAAGILADLLSDEHAAIAMESARALAMMGAKAAPAVNALAAALFRSEEPVRVMAAGALASIGPAAAPACGALQRALSDNEPSVRRCAADALAAVGPEASSAVDQLARCLKDESLLVRICAAGALGSIGPAAEPALPVLRSVASGAPGLGREVAWAIEQITGEAVARPASVRPQRPQTPFTSPRPDEWPMLGGSPSRNPVSLERDLPSSWDMSTGRNIRWSARLGNETYGGPVVSGGVVFVSTGNEVPRDPRITDKQGVLMAFRAEDGEFLWQDLAPRLRPALDAILLPVGSSSPLVEGERLYYVTAQAHLRCLDTEGFTDGENDGPLKDERRTTLRDADHVWELDLCDSLGVFPHEAPNCSVVSVGELLMVCTSNGVDEAHTNIPAPRAPSFIGVDKRTGEVAWQVVGPSSRVLHGQWSSPAGGRVNGRTLAFFGGGDGWLYALEAATGQEVWRFDGNPKDAVWRTGGDVKGLTLRNNILACPVVHDGSVFLTMGQDPMHGNGRGSLHAIDPGGRGDVTRSRRIWTNDQVGRSIATPVIDGGLIYLADYNGLLHCLERESGRLVWSHDLLAGIWGGVILADGKLYVGDEDGGVTVFRTGRKKEILAQMELDAPVWSVPAVAGGTLYIATARTLFAIGKAVEKP